MKFINSKIQNSLKLFSRKTLNANRTLQRMLPRLNIYGYKAKLLFGKHNAKTNGFEDANLAPNLST